MTPTERVRRAGQRPRGRRLQNARGAWRGGGGITIITTETRPPVVTSGREVGANNSFASGEGNCTRRGIAERRPEESTRETRRENWRSDDTLGAGWSMIKKNSTAVLALQKQVFPWIILDELISGQNVKIIENEFFSETMIKFAISGKKFLITARIRIHNPPCFRSINSFHT